MAIGDGDSTSGLLVIRSEQCQALGVGPLVARTAELRLADYFSLEELCTRFVQV
jgi:hypothetical protein